MTYIQLGRLTHIQTNVQTDRLKDKETERNTEIAKHRGKKSLSCDAYITRIDRSGFYLVII